MHSRICTCWRATLWALPCILVVLRGGSAVGRWTCDLQVAGSIPSRWLSRNIGQLSLACCIPPGSLNRVPATDEGKGGTTGILTFIGWQVWHVSFPYRWRAKLMLNCYTLFTLLLGVVVDVVIVVVVISAVSGIIWVVWCHKYVWLTCRPGSVIVDLSVDFSTSLNETFITNNIVPKIMQNLMALNNSIEMNGVKYSAAVDMIFEREVPRMNGSLISADNVTACMSVVRCALSCWCRHKVITESKVLTRGRGSVGWPDPLAFNSVIFKQVTFVPVVTDPITWLRSCS